MLKAVFSFFEKICSIFNQRQQKMRYTETSVHICKNCGKKFETFNPAKRYCSIECRATAQNQRHYNKIKDKLIAGRREKAPTYKCVICGEAFKAISSKHKLTCSANCRKEYIKKYMKEDLKKYRSEI